MEEFKMARLDICKRDKADIGFLSEEVGEAVRAYHKTFPAYEPSPLLSLEALAADLGLGGVFIKDESKRFDLNAFKVLGGSYAMGSIIGDRLGLDMEDLTFDKLTSDEVKERLGDLTFITATDGNHGRSVAWTARQLGQRAIVFMPHVSVEERVRNIEKEGALVEQKDYNYDECVRQASLLAEEKDYILVQDTAWEGYEEIPKKIVQGYTTMAGEIVDQLGDQVPTHMVLQVGVGSFAAALVGYLAQVYPDLKFIIVEPEKANCFYQTAKADDGAIHIVEGDLDSLMAGLACGVPSKTAWEVISSYAEFYVSMPDEAATDGMRVLARPLGDDPKVIAGESGAAGLGFIYRVCRDEDLGPMREALGLGEDSFLVLVNTEGDTDKESYKRIVG